MNETTQNHIWYLATEQFPSQDKNTGKHLVSQDRSLYGKETTISIATEYKCYVSKR